MSKSQSKRGTACRSRDYSDFALIDNHRKNTDNLIEVRGREADEYNFSDLFVIDEIGSMKRIFSTYSHKMYR